MQNKMGQLLTNLGLRVLEKSREYYYPPSMSRMVSDNVELSEAEFTKLIRDIDRFSAQFTTDRTSIKIASEVLNADKTLPAAHKEIPRGLCR